MTRFMTRGRRIRSDLVQAMLIGANPDPIMVQDRLHTEFMEKDDTELMTFLQRLLVEEVESFGKVGHSVWLVGCVW